jgi:folate-binding protein YgfZ
MVAWFRIVRTDTESFSLVADAGSGAAIASRLERFKLGTKAEVVPGTVDAMSVRASREGDLPSGEAVDDGRLSVVPLLWPGLAGVDVFGSAAESMTTEGDPGLVEALRIASGIPVYGSDYDDKTVPAALGVVDMSADFSKGCYTGQELVARMDSRGNNSPRQLRVILGKGEPPQVGEEASTDDGPVAVLTSVATLSDGWYAIASVKRSALNSETVTVGATSALMLESQIQAGAGS